MFSGDVDRTLQWDRLILKRNSVSSKSKKFTRYFSKKADILSKRTFIDIIKFEKRFLNSTTDTQS